MICILTQQQFAEVIPLLPSGLIVGTPLIAVDTRRAIDHGFCTEDIAFLQDNGATLCDKLPADFVIPQEEI